MSGQEEDFIEIGSGAPPVGEADEAAAEQPVAAVAEQTAAEEQAVAEEPAPDAADVPAAEETAAAAGEAAAAEDAPAAEVIGAAAEAGNEALAADGEGAVDAMDAEQQAAAGEEGTTGAATDAAAATAADAPVAAQAVVPPPLPVRPTAKPAAVPAAAAAGAGAEGAPEQPNGQQEAAGGLAERAAALVTSQPAGSEQPAGAHTAAAASVGDQQPAGGKPAAETLAAAAGGAAEKPASGPQRNLAVLHKEISGFAEEARMTPSELKRREAALQAVKTAVDAAFPTASRRSVQAFGSFAHGVSLPGADLDVVVSGVMTPIARGGGFTIEQRELLGPLLKRLSSKLQEAGAVRKRPLIIFNARVPIIKAESSEGVRLDICINTDDGPKAAGWLSKQCESFPTLRPLCLVIRGLLAEQRLADAATGGLSNWALCNMVLALLLEQQKANLPVSNAGHLLLGFLKYYGRVFELEDEAVATGQGGIVPREQVPASAAAAPKALPGGKPPPQRLCVVDPLTGRDVTGGVHRIAQVRACFKDAASKLELLIKQEEPPQGGFLPFLFNVDAALRRAKPSAHSVHGTHGAAAGSHSKPLIGVPTAPRGTKRAQEGPAGGEGGGKRLHREAEGSGPALRGKGPGGRALGPSGPRAVGGPGGGFFGGPGPGRGGGGWAHSGPSPQGGRGFEEPPFERRGPAPGRGGMGGRGGRGRPPFEDDYLPAQQRNLGPGGYGPGPGRQPGMGQPGVQQGGMGVGGGMGGMPQAQLGMGVQQQPAAAGMMAQVQQLASLPPQQLQQLLALAQQAQQVGQGQPAVQQAGVMLGLQGTAGMMAPQQGMGMPQQQAMMQPGLTMDQQALLLASQQLLMQQAAAGAVPQMQQGAGGLGLGQPQGMLQQMAPQHQAGSMLMGAGGMSGTGMSGTGMSQMQQGGMMMPPQAQQQYSYGGGY